MWKPSDLVKSLKSFRLSKRYVGILHNDVSTDRQNWNRGDFLRALDISLYTNSAIYKRAAKVSEIEFLLRDAKGEEIEKDPILDLLYKPNEVFTGREFWKLYQIFLDSLGEVYIWLESDSELFDDKSKIKAMHLLPPTRVTPHFDENGKPTKYEYKTDKKTIPYKPEEVLYINNPDPNSPLRGRSLLKAGVTQILTESQINEYHSKVLANGGKVEGVFKFKTGPLTKEQLEEIKDKYKKEYASAKKAGIPLFLGGEADYVKTGLTPDELAFLQAKKMTLEDICILTGVPKSMLASTADVKFDNADADRAIFLRETIKPLLVTLTTHLDERLFPGDKTLTFVDPTPEDIERKLKETESGIKNSYMTINEARERHGLDPVEDGDKILVPFNMIPLDQSDSSDETKSAKKKDTKDIHPLQDADVREMWGKMQIKRMDAREKPFKKKLRDYFTDQEKRLVEQLQPSKNYKFRKKDILDEIFQLELEVTMGKEFLLPLLEKLLIEAGIDAMELAGSEFEFVLSDDIKSWLDNRSDVFLNQINETTFKKLKKEFAESLALGENREQLIKRIEETYENIRKTRAALIARTEVHNATQFGTIQGYKQSGLTIKVWVAVMDSHTRISHASIDGQERPIDRPFSNGLMFPGDPSGPAEEVVNCRCVV